MSTTLSRRRLIAGLAGLGAAGCLPAAARADERPTPQKALCDWYRLVLELVRHTATYSPPVASRAFAYLGVTGYEVVASGTDRLASLAGQLNGLTALPRREPGAEYDDAAILHAAMGDTVRSFFGNTGPTGQRAMTRFDEKAGARITKDLSADVASRSMQYGKAVAKHILDWSLTDGGAVIENLGFPMAYDAPKGPSMWVPTSAIALQQMPLLPSWGKNRTFAMPNGASCPLPPPPDYSEDQASAFFREAKEVYDVSKALTPEQKAIARFWSDDPMLSPTPPGHWISIAVSLIEREQMDEARSADLLARLGITLADAFIACWESKFEFDLLRPVTFIRRHIDPKWEAMLITPPFPEYPSGHSTQSGAAAAVLTHVFGENYAFTDATHERDGLKPRHFASFAAAAEEAGISRLYGGIHFRAAIVRGLEQGRCVGAHATALKTLS